MEYSMEFLIKKLAEHAIKAEENRAQWIRDFKQNYPEEPIPDHFKEDFNLPAALASICREILRVDDLRK